MLFFIYYFVFTRVVLFYTPFDWSRCSILLFLLCHPRCAPGEVEGGVSIPASSSLRSYETGLQLGITLAGEVRYVGVA